MAKKMKRYIKGYVEKAQDGELQVSIASTSTTDRDGDIIKVEGWDLKNFKKNPVMLWGHNPYSPAIGTIKDIKIDGDKLTFIPVFDMDDEFARLLYKKYEKNILNTFSVGFKAVEYVQGDNGYIFSKQELLEISAVNVPANPDARVMREMSDVYALAKSKGYKVDEEATALIDKFYKKPKAKKEDEQAKIDKLQKDVDDLTNQFKNFTPVGNSAVGNRGDSNPSKKPISALNRRTDAEVLRDSLILVDKAIEIALKNLKKGGDK